MRSDRKIGMEKAFEKILERFDEKKQYFQKFYEADGKTEEDEFINKATQLAFDDAKNIVQEVAEEYNNGWIPCSERLPVDDSICIVTVEYPNNETVVDYGWFDRIGVCWYVGMQEFRTLNIIAWQPLPELYKE